MRRCSSRDASDRVVGGCSRATLVKADDTKLMQEHSHNGYGPGEQQTTIEHAHPYGFTAVPQSSTPSSDGSFTPSAEAFVNFVNGNRSHGVAFVTGDRRYRLYKLVDGEVALHDDLGHQVHLTRDGIVVSAPNSKKIVLQIMVEDKLPQDQKYGQTAQIKQKVLASVQIDKNSVTVNHPSVVNLNAPTINLTGSTINLVGNVHLGSTGGQPASLKGTIDTGGNADVSSLATKVFVT